MAKFSLRPSSREHLGGDGKLMFYTSSVGNQEKAVGTSDQNERKTPEIPVSMSAGKRSTQLAISDGYSHVRV